MNGLLPNPHVHYYCPIVIPMYGGPNATPFRQALGQKDMATALQLMNSGKAQIIEECGNNLVFAIQKKLDPQFIEQMIRATDLRILNSGDPSPIFAAVSTANVAITHLLIQAKADIFIEDRQGRTPLFHAVVLSSVAVSELNELFAKILETVQILVIHGALLLQGPSRRKLPLLYSYLEHYQFYSLPGDPQLVKYLVAEGSPAPSAEEVAKLCSTSVGPISAAIEEGLWCKSAREITGKELSSTLPSSLVAIIRDYVYQPISSPTANL